MAAPTSAMGTSSLDDLPDLHPSHIRRYRSFLFPEMLAQSSHSPSFSLDDIEAWIMPDAWNLFRDCTEEVFSADSISGFCPTLREIKEFRSFILPKPAASHPFFSLENTDTWVCSTAIQAHLASISKPVVYDSSDGHASARTLRANAEHSVKIETDSSVSLHFDSQGHSSPDIIDLVDSDDDNDSIIASSRPSSPLLSSLSSEAAIDFDDSLPSSPEPLLKRKRSESGLGTEPDIQSCPLDLNDVASAVTDTWPAKRQCLWNMVDGPIKITKKEIVDEIITMDTVALDWGLPTDATKRIAYLVDLSYVENWFQKKNGDDYEMIGLIRSESQDSWNGSSGKKKGDTLVAAGIFEDDCQTWCRRAQFECNGVKRCKFFNQSISCEEFGAPPNQWNGAQERNRKAAQRRQNAHSKAALRDHDLDKLEGYRCSLNELKTLVDKSLQQSKNLDNRWKATQSELKLIPRRDPRAVRLVTQKDEIKNDQEREKSNRKQLNQRIKAIKDSEEYQSLQDRLKGSRTNGNRPITSRSPSSLHPSNLPTISLDSPMLSSNAPEIAEPEPDLEPPMTLSSSVENPATNSIPNGMSNLEVFIDEQLDRWLLDKGSEYSLSDIETFIDGLPYM